MDYILNNKEWILSGIGIALISVIWKFLFKRNNDAKNSSPISNITTVLVANNAQTPSVNELKLGENAHVPDNKYKNLTRTLFVDDDTRFKVVEILKKTGWIHTKKKADIINLDDPDVIEANVIFVDINGVGVHLFKDEGLGLAVALKKKYPEKKIVIYSAEQHGDRFHRAFRDVDGSLPKNAEPYEFINLLEAFSIDLFNK